MSFQTSVRSFSILSRHVCGSCTSRTIFPRLKSRSPKCEMHGLFGSEGDIPGRSGRVRFTCRRSNHHMARRRFRLSPVATRPTLGLDKVHRQNSRQSLDAAQSPENSMFKYQTTESYAPLGPMSGANYVLTAELIHLCKITQPVESSSEAQASYFPRAEQLSRASRLFRLLLGGQNDIVRSDRMVGQLEPFGL